MSDEPTRCRRFGDSVETSFVRDMNENATRRTPRLSTECSVLAWTCDTCKREFKGRYAVGHDEAHGETRIRARLASETLFRNSVND